MSQDKNKYEQLGYGSKKGLLAPGLCRQVISGCGATRQLKLEESGALCLFDRAPGIVFTLPLITADNIGAFFEFLVTVSITSNAAKVITSDTATEFLLGEVMIGSETVGDSGDCFAANGSTHVAISSSGSTTGGLIGSKVTVTAISGTQWAVTGLLIGSGTLADPFATS